MTAISERDIDQQLAWSLWQWERLPRVIDEIDTWDLIGQLEFVEGWPLEEERLARLARQAADGVFTPDQLQRYRGLRRAVDRNRPLIERPRNNA